MTPCRSSPPLHARPVAGMVDPENAQIAYYIVCVLDGDRDCTRAAAARNSGDFLPLLPVPGCYSALLLAVIFSPLLSKASISGTESKPLAVFLQYYQRDQWRLQRLVGEVTRYGGGGRSNFTGEKTEWRVNRGQFGLFCARCCAARICAAIRGSSLRRRWRSSSIGSCQAGPEPRRAFWSPSTVAR